MMKNMCYPIKCQCASTRHTAIRVIFFCPFRAVKYWVANTQGDALGWRISALSGRLFARESSRLTAPTSASGPPLILERPPETEF